MADIEIVASAVGFDQVNKALDTTTKGLDDTAKSAKIAGDALNTSLKPGAAQANQSLTNLNRVVQDAPFGFVGIANNINPLVESFGRLKAETGSTGGAIKALLGGLTGASGLGLAFAAVTSAVTFAQIGLSSWTRGSEKAKQAADEQAKALDSVYQAQSKEGTQVISLIAVLSSETETRQRKLDAIKELNKISPETFGNLKLEKDAVIGLDTAYKNWLENQKAVIAAKVIQAKIDKVIEEQLKQQGITETGIAKKFGLSTDALKQKIISQENYIKNAKLEGNALIVSTNLLNSYKKQLKESEDKANGLSGQLQDLAAQLQEVSKGIKVDPTKEIKKKTKDVQTLAEYLAAFRESVKDEINIGIAVGDPRFTERLKLFQGAIEGVISKFNQDPKSKLVIGLQAEQARLELEKFAFEAPNVVQRKVDTTKPVDLSKLLKLDTSKLLKNIPPLKLDTWFTRTQEDFNKAFADFNATVLEESIITFADSIGGIITGQLTFGDAFKAVFASLGDNIKQLGQQLIKIAILTKIAQEQLFTNPTAALAAGIGLVVLGSVLKNLMTSKKAFATGTSFAPGGLALVGERGPELVNVPRGSQVIPAAQTATMLGARNDIQVYGVIRGQDIYISNKRYSQTYNRQT